jgi:hypothetical protein
LVALPVRVNAKLRFAIYDFSAQLFFESELYKKSLPSDLASLNCERSGNNFKVHHAPEGGWKQGQRMPYSSTTRNGRFSVNAVRKQAKSSFKAEPLVGPFMLIAEEESCTITEMEDESVSSGAKVTKLKLPHKLTFPKGRVARAQRQKTRNE